MKYLKYLFILAMINVAKADAPYPKPITLPFDHERIFKSDYYTGLIFNYDMNGLPKKKVVCHFSSVYKGWLDFVDNGNASMTEAYGSGGSVTLTLSSIHKTEGTQYHADPVGTVTVNSVNHIPGTLARASCHYDYDFE